MRAFAVMALAGLAPLAQDVVIAPGTHLPIRAAVVRLRAWSPVASR